MDNIDWLLVLKHLNKYATSEIARQNLNELKPFDSQEKALVSFSEIMQASEVLQLGSRPHMESLDLYSIWFQRLSKNATLKNIELKDIRSFCIECLALSEVLKSHKNDWTQNIIKKLMPAEEPLSAIDQIITTSGEIKPDASEELYKLTEEKKLQTKSVQNLLDRLVKDHDLEGVLQDRYVTNREGRWVLPIKSGKQHSFDGIIHASSQSKQTVFMEPQDIIPINNRLRQVENEIEAEIERLLRALTDYLHGLKEKFESTKSAMLICDIVFAKARFSIQLNAKACEFSENEVELNELRHPILVLNNETVIPNSINLNADHRILLLSGPNAGGKTVLLKAIGLSAQMARCGLPICTERHSKLPFFKKIFVAVGDSQSVDQHLSTFAAHLKILNTAVKECSKDDLILIDEICGSTDPEEGTALARSFINAYANKKAFAVVTSHLGNLKKGWGKDTGVINGSLEFDNQKGPTYQFQMGIPGSSLAIQTARRVGVSQNIVDQALEFLSPEHKEFQKNLQDAEQVKEELIQIRQKLNADRIAHEKAKAKYEKLMQEHEETKNAKIEKAVKQANQRLEEIIDKSKVEGVFKKHSELQKLKNELPEVVKSPSQKSSKPIEHIDDFAKLFPPGSKVYVESIGRDAVVQGEPNTKGEVPVFSDSMRLYVDWKLLKPSNTPHNPTKEILRKSTSYTVQASESDRVVDLRGLPVEDAISQLEIQLDTASLAGEDRIKVIHGHGTESLKRGVRSYLSRSIYVKKWKAGTPNSGGDGVTWIEIKD